MAIRVYIAGPMSGIDGHNFDAFHAAAATLRGEGFDVINPAELNVAGTPWTDCLRKDLAMLLSCDQVMVLDGWQRSEGACLEPSTAVDVGIPVYRYGDRTEVEPKEIRAATRRCVVCGRRVWNESGRGHPLHKDCPGRLGR